MKRIINKGPRHQAGDKMNLKGVSHFKKQFVCEDHGHKSPCLQQINLNDTYDQASKVDLE